MLEKGKISARQYQIVVTLFSLGSAILIVPSAITSLAQQDSWLAALAGVIIGSSILGLYVTLAKRFPDKTLAEYSEVLLGKWLGKLIAFLYFTFFFLLASLVMRNIGDFMSTIVLTETPIQAIFIMFILIVVLGAYLGIEVISRAAEVFLPWLAALLVILIGFILPQTKIERMEPLFEASINDIIEGGLTIVGIPYLELVVFLMIFPFVNKRAGKAFIVGGLTGGLILVVITLLCVLVLGWDFTARHTFPSYTLAKKIHIGEFLQRIEVMMAIIWFLTIYFKLVVCFYSATLLLAQLLNLRTYRPLLMPLGLILIVLSIVVYPNIVYFRHFAAESWLIYASFYGLLLPILLLVVAKVRGLKQKKIPRSHD